PGSHHAIQMACALGDFVNTFRKIFQHHPRRLAIRAAAETVRTGRNEHGANWRVRLYSGHTWAQPGRNKQFSLPGSTRGLRYYHTYDPIHDKRIRQATPLYPESVTSRLGRKIKPVFE